MLVDKDNARELTLELCEDGIVSWEEMARNFIMAASAETCLWVMQVYDYDSYYASDEDDEEEDVDDGLYSMRDWEIDGSLKLEVGTLISPDVFYELLNSLPPATYSNGMFQPGEPYSHRGGNALYQTFKKVDSTSAGEPIYEYIGLKPLI